MTMNHKEILHRLLQPSLIKQQSLEASPSKQEQHSVVSIVLRNLTANNSSLKHRQIDTILNTEVLLLQRIENGKIYSGEICLPGGKREQGESIVQTAIRETEEETALVIKECDLVGILSQAFVAYRRTTHTLFAYAAIFYLFESQQIKLNHEEISDFRWLPVRYFMQEQVYRPIVIPFEAFFFMNQFENFKAIKHFEWPAIDVGMKKNLYGLTLYILAFFISRMEGSLLRFIQKLNEKESKSQSIEKKQGIRALMEEYKDIKKYQIKFKEHYFNRFKIVFKEDCSLTNQEKQAVTESFNALMQQMFTERARF